MEQLKTILELALGDGYLSKPKSKNGNSHLRMQHSIKQKEYVLYKENLLQASGIRTIYREREEGIYKVCYVMTGKLPVIREARELLYSEGKKIFPKEFFDIMDAKSLAILFQDDGGHGIIRKERKKLKSGSVSYLVKPYIGQFIFNVQSFDRKSIDMLCEKINSYGIETKIFDRKGPVIAISKVDSKVKFVELVKPFICPSMMYKIEGSLSSHGKL